MTTEPPSTPYGAITPNTDTYSYQRPSTLATRALVADASSTDQQSPSRLNSGSTAVISSSSGHPLTQPATHRQDHQGESPYPSDTPSVRSIHRDNPLSGSTRPPLPKRTSWNYESAVAERSSSASAVSGVTSAIGGYIHSSTERRGSVSGRPGSAGGPERDDGGGADRPRMVDRKKSWTEQDLRREMMVNVMETPGAAANPGVKGMEWGYEST